MRQEKRVIPTIFAHNKKEFNERFKRLIKLGRDLQIDFMDGRFVKAKGISLKDIPTLRRYKKISFEAHLMCLEPVKYFKELKKKGFKKIIFHYEAVKHEENILRVVYYARYLDMKVWIAVNPETSVEKIKKFLDDVDGVLFMGVYPGREHQKFISRVYVKIKRLRAMNKKIKIQVDGGVNLNVAKKLGRIGVDFVNSGSFVADSDEPKKIIKLLERQLL